MSYSSLNEEFSCNMRQEGIICPNCGLTNEECNWIGHVGNNRDFGSIVCPNCRTEILSVPHIEKIN